MRYKPMPIPPIYDPSVVAEAIVHSLGHPSREVFVGGSGKLFEAAERVSPALVDAYLRQGNRGVDQQISDRPDDGRARADHRRGRLQKQQRPLGNGVPQLACMRCIVPPDADDFARAHALRHSVSLPAA